MIHYSVHIRPPSDQNRLENKETKATAEAAPPVRTSSAEAPSLVRCVTSTSEVGQKVRTNDVSESEQKSIVCSADPPAFLFHG